MVVAWVKSVLEVESGPSSRGHTGSKVVPRSHAEGLGVAFTNEDLS